MERERLGDLLESLAEYFRLTPHTDTLAKLDVLRDIRTDTDGGILPAGCYYMDFESNLYAAQRQETPFPVTVTSLTPIYTGAGENMKFANLVFYIGEYMQMPETANALLDYYFQPNPLAAAIQGTVLPKEIVKPIDRVTRMLFDNKIPLDTQKRVASGKPAGRKTSKPQEPIAPNVTVSLLDLPPGVQISRAMTQIDNAVFTACCSLYDAGNKHFTGAAIYKTMIGNSQAQASETHLAAIDECWTRFTSTQVEVDTGTMGEAYNFKRWIRNRRIIEGGKDTVIIGNQHGQYETTVYTMMERPVLLEYAQALNQISRYPRELQNTPVNKTLEIIILQNALLDHINAIPAISNSIRYDTLWALLDLTQISQAALRKKKTVLRGHIHKMLDYWKAQGLITGWKEQKKNNAVQSIVIQKGRQKPTLPAPATPEKVVTTP